MIEIIVVGLGDTHLVLVDTHVKFSFCHTLPEFIIFYSNSDLSFLNDI